MRTQLHIGEVAQLLDITPKAIRHYQKIGLLAAPERTPSGYRLYDAQDLLRLQRIRRLQSFGLSLKQIKAVLGNPKSEHTLRDVLLALEEELTSQMKVLAERRQKIHTLLAENTFDDVAQLPVESPSFQFIQGQLAPYQLPVSTALLEQEAQLYALLDNFHWSPNQQDKMQETAQLMIQYFTEHSDEYQELLALGERFAALALAAADAPEVQQLAQDFVRYFEHYPFLLAAQQQEEANVETPFMYIATDLMMSQFSLAQRTILNCISAFVKGSKS